MTKSFGAFYDAFFNKQTVTNPKGHDVTREKDVEKGKTKGKDEV